MQPKVLDGLKMRADGFLRDIGAREEMEANVAANVALGYAPASRDFFPQDLPVAIVGYGPSLKSTWERLKDWPGIIWTVSKAHDFLVERGITPHFHTDCDLGEHKRLCVQRPGPTVYVMAAKMHPAAIASVPDPQLFQVDILPDTPHDPRYPIFPVQFDTSMMAVEIAYQRGLHNQHWFGIDYGLASGTTYAGPHEGPAHDALDILLPSGMGTTSEIMQHGLLLAELLLYRRPPLKATIHGNGLLARFLQDRRRVKIEHFE